MAAEVQQSVKCRMLGEWHLDLTGNDQSLSTGTRSTRTRVIPRLEKGHCCVSVCEGTCMPTNLYNIYGCLFVEEWVQLVLLAQTRHVCRLERSNDGMHAVTPFEKNLQVLRTDTFSCPSLYIQRMWFLAKLIESQLLKKKECNSMLAHRSGVNSGAWWSAATWSCRYARRHVAHRHDSHVHMRDTSQILDARNPELFRFVKRWHIKSVVSKGYSSLFVESLSMRARKQIPENEFSKCARPIPYEGVRIWRRTRASWTLKCACYYC